MEYIADESYWAHFLMDNSVKFELKKASEIPDLQLPLFSEFSLANASLSPSSQKKRDRLMKRISSGQKSVALKPVKTTQSQNKTSLLSLPNKSKALSLTQPSIPLYQAQTPQNPLPSSTPSSPLPSPIPTTISLPSPQQLHKSLKRQKAKDSPDKKEIIKSVPILKPYGSSSKKKDKEGRKSNEAKRQSSENFQPEVKELPIITNPFIQDTQVMHVTTRLQLMRALQTTDAYVILNLSTPKGSSRRMLPIYLELSKRFSQCVFLYIDINQFDLEIPEFGSVFIKPARCPIFLCYRNGMKLKEISGPYVFHLSEVLKELMDDKENQGNKMMKNSVLVRNKSSGTISADVTENSQPSHRHFKKKRSHSFELK
eukprot:TRINITY_DN1816_c3_g1_i2.p1 TRINITY_DN1816_c3_g1~~TRINITY_DN1816_c3_g1_i2.p1  ORF type:complete len:370 (+),score=124.30 TRINITY_DN1816_c3_g1_i2:298-1407(+)